MNSLLTLSIIFYVLLIRILFRLNMSLTKPVSTNAYVSLKWIIAMIRSGLPEVEKFHVYEYLIQFDERKLSFMDLPVLVHIYNAPNITLDLKERLAAAINLNLVRLCCPNDWVIEHMDDNPTRLGPVSLFHVPDDIVCSYDFEGMCDFCYTCIMHNL